MAVGPADGVSDGLIVSTPIYSRTIAGTLKLVADRLAGPAADVAFAESYRRMLEAGETPPVAFPYDERVFRPRVAGFIAVGGALTSQWKSLALPLMHQMTFSAHMAVADQLLVGGAGMPRAVVLDAGALVAAARVGRSVGSQLGRAVRRGGVPRRAGAVPALSSVGGGGERRGGGVRHVRRGRPAGRVVGWREDRLRRSRSARW